MTQEEKAKAYDEALNVTKNLVSAGLVYEDAAVQIFPELKEESEDERIRKELIKIVNDHYSLFKEIDRAKTIAWLEKHGEQKSLDDVVKEITKNKETAMSFLKSCGIMNANGELADEYKTEQDEQKPNYCHHEVDLSECSEEYRKAYYDGWNNCNQQHAQLKAEQKPAAWSKEDERLCQCIIEDQEEALDKVSNDKYGHSEIISDLEEMYRERIAFLKSLKDRYTWKPSKEQMDALLWCVAHLGGADHRVLGELYEHLKQLREE